MLEKLSLSKSVGELKKIFALTISFCMLVGGFSITIGGASEDSVDLVLETEITSLNFDFEAPVLSRNNGFYDVWIPGYDSYSIMGEPILPVKTVEVLLPAGHGLADVNVQANDPVRIPGNYFVAPGQEEFKLSSNLPEPDSFTSYEYFLNHQEHYGPQELWKRDYSETILSSESNEIVREDFWITQPDEILYSSTRAYPSEYFEIVGVQSIRGYDVLILNLFPVSYVPATGAVSYYRNIDIEITSEPTLEEKVISVRGLDSDIDLIKERISNPTEIKSYSDLYSLNSDSGGQPTSIVDPADSYDYVIITSQSFLNASGAFNFEDLIDSKIAKGMTATIVTVEDIYADADYNGLDQQEEIRNFITDAYNNWETEYILLGGDGDGGDVGGESGDSIIPHRGLYANAYGDIDSDIASDVYYACLDGTYDFDGDGIYGESNDGVGGGDVDLLAEVYIGRAPVDSATEISNFVMKTLAYEGVVDDYLEEVLMLGELLWSDPTWGGDYKDEIGFGSWANPPIPEAFNTTTLYDRDVGSWSAADITNIINDDVHIINHLGHSDVAYCMRMVNGDIDNDFTNDKYYFGYSQGCYAGSFDDRNTAGGTTSTDCILEHIVCTENGAFAFIGNTRYGWGEHMGTNGSSQYYDRDFFDALFGQDIRELGPANQYSKEQNIGLINTEAMRWCYYEITLFGDPEVSIKDPVPPDHDIAVDDIDVNEYQLQNVTTYVNTTIVNQGLNNETGIDVYLIVDYVTIDMITISLGAGEYTELSFPWVTPSVSGTCLVSIEIPPISSENNSLNNFMDVEVIVGPDIGITDLSANKMVNVFEISYVNATVENLGLTSESNIQTELLVSGIVVDSYLINSLAPGESTDITFEWMPVNTGTWGVEARVVPVPDEARFDNNALNYSVLVTYAIFIEDVESGQNGWSSTGLWHISDGRSSPDPVLSSSHSWAYNDGVDYDTGATNSGSITSPIIDVSWCTDAILNFKGWYETESTGTFYDQRWVQISTDGGAFQNIAQLSGDPMTNWNDYEFNITSYLGNTIQLRFFFDTVDGAVNAFEGWYVDDIMVMGNLLEHDIAIENLTAPAIMAPFDSCWIGARLVNLGLNNETNVEMELRVDGALEGSIMYGILSPGDWVTDGFNWTPSSEGVYEISVVALPVANETFVSNNQMSTFIDVRYLPDIWVDPTSYNITVQSGEIYTDALTVGNIGEGQLFYNITSDASPVVVNGTGEALFSDNFDSETPGTAPDNFEATPSMPPDTLIISNADSVSAPNCMYLSSSSSGFLCKRDVSWDTETLSFDLKLVGGVYTYIGLSSEQMPANHAVYIRITRNSDIHYFDGFSYVDTGANSNSGWNNIALSADINTDTFSMWHNGIQIVTNAPFWENKSSPLTYFHIGGTSNVLYLDNYQLGGDGGVIFSSDVPETNALLFSDNFDSESVGTAPDNWSPDSGYNPNLFAVASAQSSSAPNSMVFQSTSGTSAFVHSNPGLFVVNDSASIKASLYMADGNGYYAWRMQSVDGDISNPDTVIQLGFDDSSGSISGTPYAILYYNGGSYINSGTQWALNTWFDLEIIPDFTAHTFDAWKDGVQIFDDAVFWNDENEIRSLHFYAVSGLHVMYVDNVQIETTEPVDPPQNDGSGWLSIVPDSGAIPDVSIGTVQVVNETSYITTAGDAGYEVSFNTSNAPILDLSLYVFIPGDQIYPLDVNSDYIVNYTTGQITTVFGGVDQGWEFYSYYNYSQASNDTKVHDVIVNATSLTPGVYRANITVSSNDLDKPEITIPVNLTVLSAPHDLAITDMSISGSLEAGKEHWINGTILNQGFENETSVNVQLYINGALEDSLVIPVLDSSQQQVISFEWIPILETEFNVSIYVVPVSNETITYNNQMSEFINVVAEPDIWNTPDFFDFVLEAGEVGQDALTIENNGLDILNYTITIDGVGSGMEFYSDWGSFEDVCPGLPVENFEGSNVGPNDAQGDSGPFNSQTDNTCYSPGALMDGFSINCIPDTGQMVVVTDGFSGINGTVVGPNSFASNTNITFPGNDVNCVGFELLGVFGIFTASIDIYGVNNVLLASTSTISGDSTGQFWGVCSGDIITRIVIYDSLDSGELIDNLSFGYLAPGGDWLSVEPTFGSVPVGSGGTYSVINETVYVSTGVGNPGPLYLAHGNIVNLTFYYHWTGDWEPWILTEDIDYTLDYDNGIITMLWDPWEDEVYTAYYNYTSGGGAIHSGSFGIVQVVNETSYITTAGDAGYEVSFNTSNAPILDLSLYVLVPGDQVYPLDVNSDYIVNYTTGQITTIFGGVDQGWEFYSYYNYSQASSTANVHDVIANATEMPPGLYFGNISINSNDPDSPEIKIPVTLTVLTPEHDLGVLNLIMPVSVSLNETCPVNVSVFNAGLSVESNITVNLNVNGALEDSITIPSLQAGAWTGISFPWVPDSVGNKSIVVDIVPVLDELVLWNNSISTSVLVVAEPEIWSVPSIYNFTLTAGDTGIDNLTISNLGLGDLFYNISDDLAPQAGGNIVQNSSFETGNFNGWIAQDMAIPYNALQVVPAGYSGGFFATNPTGNYSVITGFDGEGPDTVIVAQDLSLPSGITDLTFDYRAGWQMSPYGGTLDRIFYVDIEPMGGGAAQYSEVVLTAYAGTDVTDTGQLSGSIDISAFAGDDVRISFEWYIPEAYTGPAQFELDNVSIISSGGAGLWLSEVPDFGHISADGSAVYVANETVCAPTEIHYVDPIPLAHGNIINFTFYYYWTGDWEPYILVEGADYTIDYEAGIITNISWEVWPEEVYIAYYNYTSDASPNTHDIVANASELSPGFYQANITIESNDPNNPEIIIPVYLTVLPPEHDIAVYDMVAPSSMYLGESDIVTAIVTNQGLNYESVDVWLMEDGIPISSENLGLDVGYSGGPIFNYTPTSAGIFNISILAMPVPGETIVFNNELWAQVEVLSVPDIDVSPIQFNVSVMKGESTNRNMTIQNTGTEVLSYDIIDYVGATSGENYSVEDVAYSWVDGVTGGIPLNLSDDQYAAYSLPFTFEFYGVEYNTLYICSNGWASFTYASNNIPWNFDLPINGWENTIFALGDDWVPGGGGVYVDSLTSPNRVVVTWNQIAHISNGGSNTFEIVLYETGEIVCNYMNIETVSEFFVAGVNLGNGVEGTNCPIQPVDNEAIKFSQQSDCPWLSENPDFGSASPGSVDDILVTFDAAELDIGLHMANISITSNDPDIPEFIVPVYLTVTPPPHDMAVKSLETETFVQVGNAITVNATIANDGTSDESGLTVNFKVEGMIVDSQPIGFIASGNSVPVSFIWVPSVEGTAELEIEVLPVAGETFINNNNQTSSVIVFDPAAILIVDDDGGISSEMWYYDSVIANGYDCDIWNTVTNGTPGLDYLSLYSVVIWCCGNEYEFSLEADERAVVSAYLDGGGGKLYLSGGLIGYGAWNFGWSGWYESYLKTHVESDLEMGTKTLNGVSLDEIGDGMNLTYMAGDCCPELWGYSSYNSPIAPGTSSFDYANTTYSGMTKMDNGTYKLVYSSFDFAGIDGQASRDLLMYRILNWLGVEDIEPPQHSNEHPAIGLVTDEASQIIWVHVTDNVEVNATTIRLYVCGFPVFYTITPISGGYNVSYVHGGDYLDGDIPVRIVAEDTSGNLLDFTWVWHLDASPPVAWDIQPAPGSCVVDTNPRIYLNVTDIAGVEISTLRLYVMNFAVWYDYASISDGYSVWFDHPTGYSPGDVIECRIVAEDTFGHVLDQAWNFTIVETQTMQIPVQIGWNLISCPMMLADNTLPNALNDADTSWDYVKYYDSTDPADPWKSHSILLPNGLNDLQEISYNMGLWVHIPDAGSLGDGLIDITGAMPETCEITLHAGWNLVSYPSTDSVPASNSLPGNVDLIAVCDMGMPGMLRDVTDLSTVNLDCHCGYWIHATSDTIWYIGS